MKKILSLLLTILTFSVLQSKAQTFGGVPQSFSKKFLSNNIPAKSMAPVDVDALMAEDALNTGKDIPYRFGYNHYVNINADQQGLWETLPNGDKVWRMKIVCPDALSINLAFDQFNIPQGAKLFLYTPDKNYVVGSYTNENIQEDFQFGTDLIPGSEVIVEYNEPAFPSFHGQLNIFRITHGYRDMFKYAKAFGDAGSCNVNVNCTQGANWQTEKKAVAIIIVGGSGACTGAMIADVPHSGTPYFLSANHCGTTGTSTWVFRFNYESPGCTNVNGPTNQSVNGATLKANKASSDFTLLQLSNIPPQSYGVYYAGWNRGTAASTSSTCIHHPSGDIKKITFDYGTATNSSWAGTPANSHWHCTWDLAVTEGGSSGSPLFDQNHRIVGQLHGGASYCGGPDLSDEYGKFSLSWDLGTTNATQLKHWLDPNNTGNMTEDGFDPWAPIDTINLSLLNFNSTGASVCLGDTVVPAFTVKNLGIDTIITFNIQYHLDGAANQNYIWNGSLPHNATATITLPSFVPTTGIHNYWVHVSSVNAMGSDEQPADDTLETSFTVISGMHLAVTLTTDNNGGQTSINIKNSAGTIVNSWTAFSNNTTYNLNACLDSGCYTFTINDAGGDGICCTNGNGHFHAEDEAGHVIADGGTFTSVVTKQFCLGVPVTAAFTVVDNTICQGKSINTSNTSVNAYYYSWTLTGPATQTGTSTTFSYSPSMAGTYVLTLIANNGGSYDTSFQTITVFPVQTVNYSNTQASSSTAADASINLSIVGGTSPFTFHWANGATTEDLSNITAGTYCVTVTDANACTKSTCITVPFFAGLTELYFSSIKVFPNPANNELEIDLGGIKLNSIYLFDETGRKISASYNEKNSNIYFDLKNVAAGVYFLQGENEVGTFTRKIIVLHP